MCEFIMKRAAIFFFVSFSALLTGCAGSVKNMQALSDQEVLVEPPSDKAMVVFMRPSTLGFAIQSSVFSVGGGQDQPKLVGIVAAKKKVAYTIDPGEHTFMVVSESADFMSAELAAGKTYYALVTPRMGVWKARFSLKPVSVTELNSNEFSEWYSSCNWVGKNSDSEAWATENIADIRAKQLENYPKWMSKPVNERPRLNAGDGQ